MKWGVSGMRFDEMTKEQRKQLQSKGGKQKKKKTIKEDMELLLAKEENQRMLCEGLIISASKGNAKAADLILKIIGQDPSKQTIDDDNNPFGF